MNNPRQDTNEVQGAGVYPTDSTASNQSPTGTPPTSTVGVYNRPENAGGGMSMATIVLMIIALMVIGAIVWSVMT